MVISLQEYLINQLRIIQRKPSLGLGAYKELVTFIDELSMLNSSGFFDKSDETPKPISPNLIAHPALIKKENEDALFELVEELGVMPKQLPSGRYALVSMSEKADELVQEINR